MSINLTVPTSTENPELKPRITVVGVGGAGGNAVNNMIRRELEGVDFVVANTDAQSLSQSSAERRIQLGTNLTQGLGAGSKPETGRGAAEEAIEEVLSEQDEVKKIHPAVMIHLCPAGGIVRILAAELAWHLLPDIVRTDGIRGYC